MPDIESKEEYEKWKAERLKNKTEKLKEQQEAERLRLEEEARLSKLWICPECLNANDNSLKKCQCGYSINEKYVEYCKGNLTSLHLYKIIYKIITDDNLKDDDKEIFLSFYLLKRFPETKEARNIKKWIDDNSKEVVCGKCGSSSIYNPKFYKKDKCEKCGDFLYQYIKHDGSISTTTKKAVSDSSPFLPSYWVSTCIGVFLLIGSLSVDTTVYTSFEKQNYIKVSSLMILIGVILLIASVKKSK